jgi:hypothetical protein
MWFRSAKCITTCAAQNRRNLPQAVDSFRKALDGDPNVRSTLIWVTKYGRRRLTAAADRFRAVLDRQSNDDVAP